MLTALIKLITLVFFLYKYIYLLSQKSIYLLSFIINTLEPYVYKYTYVIVYIYTYVYIFEAAIYIVLFTKVEFLFYGI